MKVLKVGMLLAFAVICALPVAAKVDVDHDDTVDFSKYKTYAWKEGTPVPSGLMQRRIEEAIEAELQGKGLTKATSGTADVYVVVHASQDEEKRIHSSNYGYVGGPRRRGYRGWGGRGGMSSTTAHVSVIDVGTLMVDLADAETDELVWRAIGSGTLKKPSKMEKKIPKVVAKMFKDYPPR